MLLPAATENGSSAIDYAKQRGFIDCVAILESALASIDTAAQVGLPSYIACLSEQTLQKSTSSLAAACPDMQSSFDGPQSPLQESLDGPHSTVDPSLDSGVDEFLGLVSVAIKLVLMI